MADHAGLPDPVLWPSTVESPRPGPVRALSDAGSHSFAALDLGTNNCRLLIAAPTRDGFRVIDSFSRIVRLGEGLHSSGRLSEEAMQRTIGALHACAARIGRRRLRGLRAVATEACRRADNGRAFLDRVRQETGLSIDVISTREEAELALESCATLLQADLPDLSQRDPLDADDLAAGPPADPAAAARGSDGWIGRTASLRPAAGASAGADLARSRALLFDIGGGSTEVAWVRVGDGAGSAPAGSGGAGNGRPELAGYQSLPLGVITLAELFGADAYTAAGYEAMVEHVTAQLRRFEAVHCIGREVKRGSVRLLGTSGTVTTLASIALGLRRYRRVLVDGIVLSRTAAQDAITLLRGLGVEGLRQHQCVGPDRATYVLPGCAIFDAIHRLWPTDSVVVADRGLRDGMLLRMMRDRSLTFPSPSAGHPRHGDPAAGPTRTGFRAASPSGLVRPEPPASPFRSHEAAFSS